MNLLLDTHIWLWNHLEPWKVASDVNQALAEPGNELWLSPVSIWELVLLLEKKRIVLEQEMNIWIEKSKRELSLREVPFSWEVAEGLNSTLLGHHDPADRFLVATAKVHDLTLVTADERLMHVPGLNVLANR
jgi:PIN domain nuclease of toxin-antitoxin system